MNGGFYNETTPCVYYRRVVRQRPRKYEAGAQYCRTVYEAGRNLQSFEKALANSFETLSTGAVEIAG